MNSEIFNDVKAILWKELKEILFVRGIKKATYSNLVFSMIIYGIILPILMGNWWYERGVISFLVVFVPVIYSMSFSINVFVGERERKTLKTLLATRITDKGIFFGKFIFSFFYTYLYILSIVLISIITKAILTYMTMKTIVFMPYSISTIILLLTASPLLVVLATSIGIVISFKAKEIKIIQSYSSIISFVLLIISIGLFTYVVKDVKVSTALLFSGILFVLSSSTLIIAFKFFRRDKLILDID